jgi:DUF4097 and DUF4098 domain-containing protein YvlB
MVLPGHSTWLTSTVMYRPPAASHGVRRAILICALAALVPTLALPQEEGESQQTVRLSDPTRPARIKVHLIEGNIRVKGVDRQDVLVETRPDRGGAQRGKPGAIEPKIGEDDNVVTVRPGLMTREVTVQVPVRSSLTLACVQAGEILVENVEGEIEASGLNGSVRLVNVSGVALVHTINGQVKASFRRVQPNKAMSFSSLNGDIDVTMPANIRASVKLETLNGRIDSDFEIQPKNRRRSSGAANTAEDTPFVWTNEKIRTGTINGGGPEFRFQAFNGTIHLRKQ